MSAASTAAIAAAAAAAAEAAKRQEEEEMSDYGEQELRADWEFKILRANTSAFKDPDVLRRVCEEEAQAGWILLEKFDDSRLRFKRPVSAKQRDASLTVDPYRTRYGMSEGAQVAIVLGAIFIAIPLILGLIFLIAR